MLLTSYFQRKPTPTETKTTAIELANCGDDEETSTFWYALASMSEWNNEALKEKNKKVYVEVVNNVNENPYIVYKTDKTREIVAEIKVKSSDLRSLEHDEWNELCNKIQTNQLSDISKKISDAFLQEVALREHISQKFYANQREKNLILTMMLIGTVGCWVPGMLFITGGIAAGVYHKERRLKKERKLRGGQQGEALKNIALEDMNELESDAYISEIRHKREGKSSKIFSTETSQIFDPKTNVSHEAVDRDLLMDYVRDHQLSRKKYDLYSITEETRKPLMKNAIYLYVVTENFGPKYIMCKTNESTHPRRILYTDLQKKEVTKAEWTDLCNTIENNCPVGPFYLPKVFNFDDCRTKQTLIDVLYDKKLISTTLEEMRDPLHVNDGLYRDIMSIKNPQYLSRKLSDIQEEKRKELLIAMIVEKYQPGFCSSKQSVDLYNDLEDDNKNIIQKIQAIQTFLQDESVQSKQGELHFNMLTILEQSILKVSLLKDNPKLCGKFLFYTPKDNANKVHESRSLAAVKYGLKDLYADEQSGLIATLLQKYQPTYTSSYESSELHTILKDNDYLVQDKITTLENYVSSKNVIRKKDNRDFKFLSILVESLEAIMNHREHKAKYI